MHELRLNEERNRSGRKKQGFFVSSPVGNGGRCGRVSHPNVGFEPTRDRSTSCEKRLQRAGGEGGEWQRR